jgi:sugar lactone lactonase YvrE
MISVFQSACLAFSSDASRRVSSSRRNRNKLFAVCAVLAALLCGAARIASAQTAQFGWAQTTVNYVFGGGEPVGVAVDSSGNLYVAQANDGGGVYEILAVNGNIPIAPTVRSIGSGYSEPEGVAVDSSGNVYVADTANQEVKEILAVDGSIPFSPATRILASGFYPVSAAVDGWGNVYVADYFNSAVKKILAVNGTIPASPTIITVGSGFYGPWTVAVDSSGDVYVGATDDNYVRQVFEILAVNGSIPASPVINTLGSGFCAPAGVAVDSRNDVYVSDYCNDGVFEMLAVNGSIPPSPTINKIGGGIAGAKGVAVDGNGNVYVGGVFSEIPRISLSGWNFGSVNIGTNSSTIPLTFTFDMAGTLGSTAVLTRGATGLDFADAGSDTCTANTAYIAGESCTVNVTFTPRVAGARYGAATLMNSAGTVIATGYVHGTGVGPQLNFLPGTQSTIESGSLDSFQGIAVDGSGNVYITDVENNVIWKETLSAGSYTQSTIPTSSLNNPAWIAVDGSGSIYISDTGNNRVLKEAWSTAGYSESVIANLPNNGITSPLGIAVDGSGNIYFIASGKLFEETLSAGSYTQSTIPYTGISMPAGIAVDEGGNIYIVDSENNQLVKEARSASGYTQSTVPTTGLNSPNGVAIDGSGNFYIASTAGNQVIKETLSGGKYIQSVLPTSQLNWPLGVAVDGSGNVYIADSHNFKVLKEDYSDPPSLTFASTSVGSTSSDSPQTVTVENVGNASLTFPIPSKGNNPSITANFTLNSSGSSACPLLNSGSSTAGTLAADAYCLLPISFTPTVTGVLSGTLTLTDNNLNAAAPGYTSQSITLNGSGVQVTPSFTLNAAPSSMTINQGASGTSTVTVTGLSGFTGSVTLAASGLPSGVTASFSPNPATGTNVLTLTATGLAALGTATLTISGTSGTLSATTSIVLTTVSVYGLSPSSANFGAVNIGSTSQVQTITYTFGTADTLAMTTVLTQGAAGLDFADAGSDTCAPNTAYSAGQSCTVNVAFTPRFAGTRNGAVGLNDTNGNIIATAYFQGTGVGPQVGFAPASQKDLGTGYLNPMGTAVDGSGNVYVADETHGQIKEILAVNGKIPSSPTIKILGSGFSFPRGVAVDGAGNVYVADYGNNAVKKIVAVNGSIPASPAIVNLGSGFSYPWGIAVDGNGNVYFTEPYSNTVEEILAVDGSIPSSPVIQTIGSGFNFPIGVAIDSRGNVYVGDTENSAVKEILAVSGSIPASPTINTLSSSFYYPSVLAVDNIGNVYVSDYGANTVQEIQAVNGSIPHSPSIVTLASGLNMPFGVAVDSGFNVYIGDTQNNRILELDYADPPSLTFAGTAFGSTSSDSPQTVTVENVGNASLTFPIPTNGSNPSIAANFTLNSSGDSACPLVNSGSSTAGTLAAGASCQMPISFTPAAAGTLGGSLILTDNNLNAAAPAYATQTISLGGTSTQATPAITWAAPAAIIYGTALSNTQLDATSTVAGRFVYSPAAGTVLGAGQQTLTATFTPTDTVDYTTATDTMTLTVSQATPTITWAPPAAIIYGTALSKTQLDATASVPGVLAYTPAAGTVLAVGLQALSVTFTPTDTTDYTTVTATVTLTVNPATPAALYNPAPNVGTVLGTSNVLFQWTAGVATKYELMLGATGVGASDLYSSGEFAGTSATVATLPANGVTVFARLYYENIGVWQHTDYTYVEGGKITLATLSPAAGTVLTASQTFSWANGNGPTEYALYLGTTGVGSDNLYNSGQTTATSAGNLTLPTNGVKVYARFYQRINGVWQSADTTYTESGAPTPSALNGPSPAPSPTLGTSETFTWTAGRGVTDYDLYLGTTGVGSTNLYNSGHTTALTSPAIAIPSNGHTVYARLWSYINGVWQYTDYTFTERP